MVGSSANGMGKGNAHMHAMRMEWQVGRQWEGNANANGKPMDIGMGMAGGRGSAKVNGKWQCQGKMATEWHHRHHNFLACNGKNAPCKGNVAKTPNLQWEGNVAMENHPSKRGAIDLQWCGEGLTKHGAAPMWPNVALKPPPRSPPRHPATNGQHGPNPPPRSPASQNRRRHHFKWPTWPSNHRLDIHRQGHPQVIKNGTRMASRLELRLDGLKGLRLGVG